MCYIELLILIFLKYMGDATKCATVSGVLNQSYRQRIQFNVREVENGFLLEISGCGYKTFIAKDLEEVKVLVNDNIKIN